MSPKGRGDDTCVQPHLCTMFCERQYTTIFRLPAECKSINLHVQSVKVHMIVLGVLVA